ncbi:MAG: hypothetical protein II165_00590 [Bacteroidales bacterium]|nr:hypothetical protein [Bacteroidales bacterium]
MSVGTGQLSGIARLFWNIINIIPSLSKPLIDEIDKILATHYGFTDEELDFIINYDIKYRMGDELGEE